MAIAEPLIDFFGEIVIRKLFSRTWNLREEGIKDIENLIMQENDKDKSEVFIHSLLIVKVTIIDKIVGVCQRSIQFLINLCNFFPNVRFSDR